MIFVLSFLISSNLTLMIYKKRELKMKILQNLSLGGAGSILGILSGILTSALCLSCLAPLFAFLGLGVGTLFFAFKYKFYFFLTSSIILVFYKSINKCEKC
jgi:type IV secretory pathway TrbD component